MSDEVAVVTGANGGLGFETALELARRGLRVVMACRSLEKGTRAQQELLAELPGAAVTVMPLDVSEPASIREFGRRLAAGPGVLDVLVNNAGVVLVPLARNSVGHEMHLATNYLGAFALTGTLLPLFREGSPGRIVNVGSLAHRFAKREFDDPNFEKTPYREWQAYARSKLRLLRFTMELDRRLRRAGSPLLALAAHPGFAKTNAGRQSPLLEPRSALRRWLSQKLVEPLIPTPGEAARPIVHAARGEGVRGGEYYGPSGLLEISGRPGRARVHRAARDAAAGERLWAWSEEITGVRYLSAR